jgi:Ubiquitin-specific protease C-terminal
MQVREAAAGYAEKKKLRAVKVYSSRVFEVCSEDASIDDIDTSYWQLRVEPVPQDDMHIAEQCKQDGMLSAIRVLCVTTLHASFREISAFNIA